MPTRMASTDRSTAPPPSFSEITLLRRKTLTLVPAQTSLAQLPLWGLQTPPQHVFGATLLVGAGFVERPTVPQEAPPVIPAAETAGTPAEDFVTLYRQGNPETVYSSSRPVSTSLSSELTHYDPEAQLLQFKVPQSTFDQWRMQRLIETFNDLHAPSGIITPETRILPPASGQLNQFLVKPR